MEVLEVTPNEYEEVCDFLAQQIGFTPTRGARHEWLYGRQPHAPEGKPVSLAVRMSGRVVGHLGVVWHQVALPQGLVPVAELVDFNVDHSARGLAGAVLARALLRRIGLAMGFGAPDILALWGRAGAQSVILPVTRWVSLLSPCRALTHGREGKLRRYARLAHAAMTPVRLAARVMRPYVVEEAELGELDDLETALVPFCDHFTTEWLHWRLGDRWGVASGLPSALVARGEQGIMWWALVLDQWILGAFGRVQWRLGEEGERELTARDLCSLAHTGIAVDELGGTARRLHRAGFWPFDSETACYHLTAAPGHEDLLHQVQQVHFRFTGI